MTSLLPLLQSATVGSRELDDAVLRVAGWEFEPGTDGYLGVWIVPNGKRHVFTPQPTRSLDAIVALIEARGWAWDVESASDEFGALAHVSGHIWGRAVTPPLALCIAFVRAVEAQ